MFEMWHAKEGYVLRANDDSMDGVNVALVSSCSEVNLFIYFILKLLNYGCLP